MNLKNKTLKAYKKPLLSVLSGLLLAMPWLGLPIWFVFIGFVPLLLLEDELYIEKAPSSALRVFQFVFFAVLIWNVLAAWWMVQASFAGVLAAMVFNSFLMAMVWWGAHQIRRKYSSSLGYLALVVLWISYEYLQFNWDLEWPCLQLGSILAGNVKVIQWYEYTGAFGGSLWVLSLNVLLFGLLKKLYKKVELKHWIPQGIATLLVFTMPLVLSLIIYSSYKEEGHPKQISIIQPNADPYTEKYDLASEKEKLTHFLTLSEEVCSPQTDFLIGPETVFENKWSWNEDSLATNIFLDSMLFFIQKYPKVDLLFGVSSFKVYPNKMEASYTARNNDGLYYDRYSTALFLNRVGETQLYHKSKLVMGVEKTPFLRYFPFLKSAFIDLGGASGALGTDAEASNFVASDGTVVAPVICFESVFGEYVTEYVKKGAQLIFVITNDGWWKNSRGYKQHLLFSKLRAIETRRSIARAANTGTSCFINQRGEVLQPTPWWQEAAISGAITTNKELTFYVVHGDFIGRGAVFASVFLMLLGFVRRFK